MGKGKKNGRCPVRAQAGPQSPTSPTSPRSPVSPTSPTSPSKGPKDADTETQIVEVPPSSSASSSSDSVPTSAALTANEDLPQSQAPASGAPLLVPPPPPPPPQPPVQVSPPLKGNARRFVRRNSASQAQAANGDINFDESQHAMAHGRSVTEPSSASASADGFTSTPDLPSTLANSNSNGKPWGKAKLSENAKSHGHANPAQEFMSALKRSNTIDSAGFSPSSLKKSRAAAASRLCEADKATNGNASSSPNSVFASEETSVSTTADSTGTAIAKEESDSITTKESAAADANGPPESTSTPAESQSAHVLNDNNGSESAKPKRLSSSPPPIKPKPESLSLNRRNSAKGRLGHERGASGSDLLRSVVVKEATQVAAQGNNGKPQGASPPPSTPAAAAAAAAASSPSALSASVSTLSSLPPDQDRTPSASSTASTSTPPTTPARNPSRPSRTPGSVQKLAASFEGRIQLSAPPTPGTPMTLRNRMSVASTKTLKSAKSSSSVLSGNGGGGEERGTPDGEDGTMNEGDGVEEVGEGTNEEGGDAPREQRERERERMLSIATPVPPAGYDVVIADLFRKSRGSKATLEGVDTDIDTGIGAGCPPRSSSQALALGPGTRPASPPKNNIGTSSALAKEALAKAKARRPSRDNKEPESAEAEKATTEASPSPSVAASSFQTGPKGEEVEGQPKVTDSLAQTQASIVAPTGDAGQQPERVPLESESHIESDVHVEKKEPDATAAGVKKPNARRSSTLPPSRPPPPVPEETQAEADGEDGKEVKTHSDDIGDLDSANADEKKSAEKFAAQAASESADVTQSTAQEATVATKPAKRYSVPPPSRQPPPPPVDEDKEGEIIAVKFPPPISEADEGGEARQDDADGRQGRVLSSLVVQEPEDMDEITSDSEHARERDVKVNIRVQEVLVHAGAEYDSAEDSSSDDEEQCENYRTALSQNGSSSLPPTPPTKHDSFFPPMRLTSKWSRNTSAVQSLNASASTLALHERLEIRERLQAELLEVEQETEVDNDNENNDDDANDNNDDESVVEEGTTLAHANFNDTNGLKDGKNVEGGGDTEDLMESRFKFPPVSAFPPPAPLPLKRPTATNANRNLKVFGMRNESETSLASGRESGDDADRDTIMETNVRRFRKKSKSKAKLTSAIAAALAKGPLPPLDGLIVGSDEQQAQPVTVTRSETESTSRSSSEETNPMARQMKARYAKIDTLELPRPAPFPTFGDGVQGRSQSTPEMPTARRPNAAADGDDRRTVRLSSKLHPITGPQRMNTSPSTITAWGKHKALMSSETLGTIGTIATEPGDLETSQFGGLNGAAASQEYAHTIGHGSPPPPSSFFHRMMSDGSRRGPPARRQTTSSQASRFVEDLPVPPFLKRSISPNSGHQRSATVSFSSRARTGSISPSHGGPPTRKNLIVPELRAATIEAAERPLSAVDGDFVLVEEPEEFDIPRAEWDLPRIPSGSLRMPSSMDLKTKFREMDRMNGREMRPARGPSSAPATTSPSMPMAPPMQYSQSEAKGTMSTADSNASSNTSNTCASAPAAPGPIAQQASSGSEASPNGRLSSNELLDLWGRVGVFMSDAAALLHDKSRRVLVGDGTFPGFVLAVTRQVPTACIPSRTARYPYGHLIYFQTAGTVHKRYAEIMPGDVIVLQNALFKGVRGPLHQSYQEELGSKGVPVVGIIGEHELKKCKVRVYQANQHVGIQTVEYVSYRFPDLKSGTIKIFRVPDS